MENKLQQLTQTLYDRGLERGRAEADRLIEEARTKAAAIVKAAEQQAAQTVQQAEQKAADTARNAATEIRQAGLQALDQVKERIASLILAGTTDAGVKQAAVDPDFIKEMLLTVGKQWDGQKTAVLPASEQTKLEKKFEKAAGALMQEGIEVQFSDRVSGGFKIGPKNGGYHISFTEADFRALMSELLREKVYNLLYHE